MPASHSVSEGAALRGQVLDRLRAARPQELREVAADRNEPVEGLIDRIEGTVCRLDGRPEHSSVRDAYLEDAGSDPPQLPPASRHVVPCRHGVDVWPRCADA